MIIVGLIQPGAECSQLPLCLKALAPVTPPPGPAQFVAPLFRALHCSMCSWAVQNGVVGPAVILMPAKSLGNETWAKQFQVVQPDAP